MSMTLPQFAQPLSFDRLQQIVVVNGAIGRLLMACFLGALVGLQREIKRKAAGVRTNLLICMGSAFFTLLSAVLAGDANPDKGRVASNIVQGIGFLGAGLILHNRSRVSGMACGAGLYAAAAVAAIIVIAALEVVGFLERNANIKMYPLLYEVRGSDQTRMMESILEAMDNAGQRLASVDRDAIGEMQRVSFSLTATKKEHERLRGKLLDNPGIAKLFTFRDPEED